jgi:hypothetical protein
VHATRHRITLSSSTPLQAPQRGALKEIDCDFRPGLGGSDRPA